MANFRNAASLIILVLLALGYAASQIAFFNQTAAEYAARIDQPPIRWLALVVLVACVLSAFWRGKAGGENHE